MWQRRVYQSPEGDDQGGGGAKPDEAVTRLTQQVETLTEQLKLVAQGMTSMDQVVKNLATKAEGIDSLQESLEGLKKGGGSGGGGGLPDDSELDTLSRKELIALIESRVGGKIEEHLKPVKEGVEKAFSRMDEQEAINAVGSAKAEFKDFLDWKKEMGDILKANPELSVRRAYLLARAENPGKRDDLDKKYTPTKNGGDTFTGGFFPTSSRTVSSTKMNSSQAAEAAWQSVMASLGSDAEDSITSH